MISIEAVSKDFGRLKALQQVSLELGMGRCIALIGPNGSGKTTLIKSILGMVVPSAGTIRFDGADIRHSYRYRERIGYMPQIGAYPENMTIGNVVDTVCTIRNVPLSQGNQDLYRQYGLEAMRQKRMASLSGGTRQKVSAALAFMFPAEVYILDEPTAGLDLVASEILKEKVMKVREQGQPGRGLV